MKLSKVSSYSLPKIGDFRAYVINNDYIEIIISNSLNLIGASLKILGENRNFLIEIKEPAYINTVHIYSGNPMFIELHISTRILVCYVEGSGKDFYMNLNN